MSRIIPKRRIGYKWGDPMKERARKLQEEKCFSNSIINTEDNYILQNSDVSMVNLEEICPPLSNDKVVRQPRLGRGGSTQKKKIIRRRIIKKKKRPTNTFKITDNNSSNGKTSRLNFEEIAEEKIDKPPTNRTVVRGFKQSSNIVSSRAQERSKLITPPLDNEDESSIETLDEEIIGIGDGYLDNGMSEELELSGNEGEDED